MTSLLQRRQVIALVGEAGAKRARARSAPVPLFA